MPQYWPPAAAPAPAARALGEGQVVEVPAVGVLFTVSVCAPAGKRDAGGDGGPGLVAAGVRHGDRAGQVGAGGVGDVQRVGDPVGRGHPEADRVDARRWRLDGVVEPLSGGGPAHVVGAAGRARVLGVRGVLQVDPVRAVAVGGAVGGSDAVGDALPAGVVVRHLDRAGHGGGRPAERLVTAAASAAAAGVSGKVRKWKFQPFESWSTVSVWVPAGRVTLAVDGGPGLVAAGVRHGDRAGQVGARGVRDVQRVGDPVRRGQPEGDAVGARRGDVDGVVEPLPGRGPAHVVGAAGHARVLGVGGVLQVDPVRAVAVRGAVGGGDAVGDALAAGVVVRGLHGARHRRRGAPVGGFCSTVGRVLRPVHQRQGGQDRDGQGRAAPAALP